MFLCELGPIKYFFLAHKPNTKTTDFSTSNSRRTPLPESEEGDCRLPLPSTVHVSSVPLSPPLPDPLRGPGKAVVPEYPSNLVLHELVLE